MRAMVITSFGGPEVFEAREVPTPEPKPDEVRVKVHATSINPVDLKIRQAGQWAGIEPPTVIGYDVSGVIDAVGEAVHDFTVGEQVYYTPLIFGQQGSYAEYHVANEAIVAAKPANLSHAEAASIPLAGGTAWDALITRGDLKVGETVLIHGAGGVGSLAIQIAKAAGARVFVNCSDYMVGLAERLGAQRAISYKSEDFLEIIDSETGGAGVNLVFDTVGGDYLSKSIAVTAPFGRMVGIVSNSQGSMSAAFQKNITVHTMFLQRARYKLKALKQLIEREQLKPVIDSVLPLEQVAQAHQRLAAGGVKGKIVLEVN
ncbi:MAG: zinc-dependent alcohol dehydrogenase family protein [Anaerolineales bacterium]|jgi:NADPH2:quinone reductase